MNQGMNDVGGSWRTFSASSIAFVVIVVRGSDRKRMGRDEVLCSSVGSEGGGDALHADVGDGATREGWHGAISLFVKLARCSPDRAHRWKPLSLAAAANEEMGNIFVGSNHQPEPHSSSYFPMVLVQIPIYNEKELNGSRSYGVASMAMVFINKAILMKYAYSLTLLTLQQVATALVIHLGRVVGYTKFSSVNLATAKKLFPVSLFYNANVAFALASLKGINIPMYIALKRLTPLAVLVAGLFLGKGRLPMQLS